jgi:hypothetical protein
MTKHAMGEKSPKCIVTVYQKYFPVQIQNNIFGKNIVKKIEG